MSITGLAFLLTATSYGGEAVALPAPHVKLAIGYDVVDRQLQPLPRDQIFVADDSLTAWSAIAGVPAGFIEHVWSRDGVEVAREVLPVGSNRQSTPSRQTYLGTPGWRSWSRHTVEAGSYEVRIIGPDGTALGITRFEVADLEEDC